MFTRNKTSVLIASLFASSAFALQVQAADFEFSQTRSSSFDEDVTENSTALSISGTLSIEGATTTDITVTETSTPNIESFRPCVSIICAAQNQSVQVGTINELVTETTVTPAAGIGNINITDLAIDYTQTEISTSVSSSIESTASISYSGDNVNSAVNVGNIDASVIFTGASIGSNAVNVNAISDQFNTTIVTTSALNGMDNSQTDSTLSNSSSVTADSADLLALRSSINTDVIGAINQAETTIPGHEDYSHGGWGRWGSWGDRHGDLEIVNVAYNSGDLLASINIAAGGLSETVTTVPGAEGNVDAQIATLVPTTIMGLSVATSAIGAANISSVSISR